LGFVLLILWCLSPLGGQASLRLLGRGWSTVSTTVPLDYFSTGPATAVFASRLGKSNMCDLQANLLTSAEVRGRNKDVFGSVKIPRFNALCNSTASAIAADGWRPVLATLREEDFSSLIGVRVMGLPLDAKTHFGPETSYVSADCQPFVQLLYDLNRTRAVVDLMSRRMHFNLSAAAAAALLPGQITDGRPGEIRTSFFNPARNVSLARQKAFLGLLGAPSFLSSSWSSPDAQSSLPDADIGARRSLVFGSVFVPKKGDGGGRRQPLINLTNCTLAQTHIEAAEYCSGRKIGTGCRMLKPPLSLADRRLPTVTLFDHVKMARYLSNYMPELMSGRSHSSSFAEGFFDDSNPASAFHWAPCGDTAFIDVSRLPAATFSTRFSLLLNTYYQSLFRPGRIYDRVPLNRFAARPAVRAGQRHLRLRQAAAAAAGHQQHRRVRRLRGAAGCAHSRHGDAEAAVHRPHPARGFGQPKRVEQRGAVEKHGTDGGQPFDDRLDELGGAAADIVWQPISAKFIRLSAPKLW
jgi:hypothetical protein